MCKLIMHNRCFCICYRCKIWASLRKRRPLGDPRPLRAWCNGICCYR